MQDARADALVGALHEARRPRGGGGGPPEGAHTHRRGGLRGHRPRPPPRRGAERGRLAKPSRRPTGSPTHRAGHLRAGVARLHGLRRAPRRRRRARARSSPPGRRRAGGAAARELLVRRGVPSARAARTTAGASGSDAARAARRSAPGARELPRLRRAGLYCAEERRRLEARRAAAADARRSPPRPHQIRAAPGKPAAAPRGAAAGARASRAGHARDAGRRRRAASSGGDALTVRTRRGVEPTGRPARREVELEEHERTRPGRSRRAGAALAGCAAGRCHRRGTCGGRDRQWDAGAPSSSISRRYDRHISNISGGRRENGGGKT